MPTLSFKNYEEMSEPERVLRIAALLATAVRRFYQDKSEQSVAREQLPLRRETGVDAAELVTDETERRIVAYLARVGAALSPWVESCSRLSAMTVTRRLAHLRSSGLLSVTGQTRSVRYALCSDFSVNQVSDPHARRIRASARRCSSRSSSANDFIRRRLNRRTSCGVFKAIRNS